MYEERGYGDPDLAKETYRKTQELYSIKPNLANLEETEIAYMTMEDTAEEARKEEERIAESKARKETAIQEEQRMAEAKAQAEAEERQINEQSAAASNVIQSAIKDPFSIADAELQKAIQTKQEINRRKGGIML